MLSINSESCEISGTGQDAKHIVLELNHSSNCLNISLGMTWVAKLKR